MGTLAIAYDHKGQENKSEELIRELLKKSAESPIGSPSFYAARAYAQRNDIESAFSMLEKAFLDHEPEMIWLKVDPLFNSLYGDPRWKELLDKIGFPSNDES